jgi:hypothetical protein
LAFLTQNKAKFGKMLIITLVFEKNANFFAQNCQKSQKIVIITSAPGLPDGIFWKASEWKNLVSFMIVWYILWVFLLKFSHFDILPQEQIWQPCHRLVLVAVAQRKSDEKITENQKIPGSLSNQGNHF